MKTKSISLAVAVLTLLGINMTARAQAKLVPGTSMVPEQVVDTIAGTAVSYWSLNYQFDGTVSNVTTHYDCHVTLQPKQGLWMIYELRLNDLEVPIDPNFPLDTIPPFKGLVQNFSLNAQGMDANNQAIRNGYFQPTTPTFGSNDDINIKIYLNYVTARLPYKLPAGHTAANTRIQSSDGLYNGYYDSASGMFVIGFDPLNPPSRFDIIDTSKNAPFDSIPFAGSGGGTPSNPTGGHGVNLQLFDGTFEATLHPTEFSAIFTAMPLDQSVTRNGTNYSAKYVILHTDPSLYVHAYVNGLTQGSVLELYGRSDSGTMVFLGKQVASSNYGWSLTIDNVSGYSTYKAVVYGQTLDPVAKATFQYYQAPYMWGTTIGKGAVPAPTN